MLLTYKCLIITLSTDQEINENAAEMSALKCQLDKITIRQRRNFRSTNKSK